MIQPSDGQTDGRAIAYSALSLWCRAIKTARTALAFLF